MTEITYIFKITLKHKPAKTGKLNLQKEIDYEATIVFPDDTKTILYRADKGDLMAQVGQALMRYVRNMDKGGKP